MKSTVKRYLSAGAAILLVLILEGADLLRVSSGLAQADPVWHQVTYSVSAKSPIWADIFYQDQDPAKWSDYSHNNYAFTPQVHVDIAAGKPWTLGVQLLNPDQWATVAATTGREPGIPQFHCDLAVDGTVVVSKDGDRGVLCSLRNW